ncbi:hypothetical protein [Sphingomonas sp. S2-65]|uniref:hypothetical protein n=1 Tax=Sphingomonas sp. S2-65 TaxID=2903960 RepID=UPI001F218F06|nr:hypothetical protein [Sphingomonas sp. S2-65]UYY57554.1 hypothetical protein LZ586_12895 [Sphingomonas sp. S2-65]
MTVIQHRLRISQEQTLVQLQEEGQRVPLADIPFLSDASAMQLVRTLLAVVLVVALCCVVVGAMIIAIGSAFYAFTALSTVAFAQLVVAVALALAALALLNHVAFPMIRRRLS